MLRTVLFYPLSCAQGDRSLASLQLSIACVALVVLAFALRGMRERKLAFDVELSGIPARLFPSLLRLTIVFFVLAVLAAFTNQYVIEKNEGVMPVATSVDGYSPGHAPATIQTKTFYATDVLQVNLSKALQFFFAGPGGKVYDSASVGDLSMIVLFAAQFILALIGTLVFFWVLAASILRRFRAHLFWRTE